jgi:nucleotide-binding universal stress UspA family protein
MVALRWALKQAEATGADVEAVHAWEYPISFGTPVALLPGEDLEAEAGTALAAAIGKVTAGDSGVTVRRRVVLGDPTSVLLGRAEDADLLVVWNRGYGGFARSLLGSVGVDGSPSSRRALDWAMRQAEATGMKIVALLAWRAPTGYGTGALVASGVDWANEARASLESIVAPVSEEWPQVPVEQRVLEGHPAEVLLAQTEGADLLVVGSRGHGGFAGALLGSVSTHCVHHATCPVVVIHDKA